ncbi:MAG: DUF445 family protein [Longimicrobiales bacterium]
MTPLQAALTIGFGALAGGVTNAVAIWMLFHPYEPPRLGRRRLGWFQGAVPKNKARLAAAMGRTVGTQLLTPADVTRAIDRPEVRAAFDARLAAFMAAFLERERGPLKEELPPALAAELEILLGDVANALLLRLDEFVVGEEFERLARAWAARLGDELRDRPIGDLLTADREAALAEAAERWIRDAVDGAGFEATVSDYLERSTAHLLEPGRTFEEILPTGLVAAVEKGIAGYLPVAIERLGGLLEDPGARARAERVLHEVLERFMRDLRFHQRLVAALVITPETIDKVLRAVEAEGAEKIAELLQDPTVRDAMARSVNDAIVDFLRKEVRGVLGGPADPSVADARATAARAILTLARDPQTATFLAEKLRATLAAAEQRTWGELFRHLRAEHIADALTAAARSPRAAELYREAVGHLARRILDRPIGRPADHLPDDAPQRLEAAIGRALWPWALEQAPIAVETIDIQRRVEEKILEFPPQRVERLIRDVTERELVLIVRLGYVLGGLIGAVSVAISALLG